MMAIQTATAASAATTAARRTTSRTLRRYPRRRTKTSPSLVKSPRVLSLFFLFLCGVVVVRVFQTASSTAKGNDFVTNRELLSTSEYPSKKVKKKKKKKNMEIDAPGNSNPATVTNANGKTLHNFIHIVKTKFMQHQPDLVELGLARLKLFQAFTLPSMEYQKSRNFLWIIRTDPNLIPELKKALVETLSRSPLLDRIVLLGDNNNPGSFHHSPPLSKNPGQILFGNPELYSDYLERAKSGSHVVVETRLDADDGLPLDFVTTIQAEVQERIQFKNDWIQWCSTHHQEWQATHPHQADAQSSTLRRGALRRVGGVVRNAFQLGSPYGYVETLNVTKCITAGLTVAYGKNTTRGDLPGKMVHTHIQRLIPYCSPPLPAKRPKHKKFYRTHCLQPMYNDKPGAIRARSPTSTGMVHVAIPRQEEEENNNNNNDKKENKARLFPGGKDPLSLLWDGVENSYGMSRHQIRELRTYLVQHTSRIAADNLKGQCTKGHSCTAATKTILATLAGVNSTEVVGKTL